MNFKAEMGNIIYYIYLTNWNILVVKGKEIKRDSVSSGEPKWKRQKINNIIKNRYNEKHENLTKNGESPVL